MNPIVLATAVAVPMLLAATTVEARPAIMCPMIYKPVCAITRDGVKKTFGNDCEARVAHAHVIHEGRCRNSHRH